MLQELLFDISISKMHHPNELIHHGKCLQERISKNTKAQMTQREYEMVLMLLKNPAHHDLFKPGSRSRTNLVKHCLMIQNNQPPEIRALARETIVEALKMPSTSEEELLEPIILKLILKKLKERCFDQLENSRENSEKPEIASICARYELLALLGKHLDMNKMPEIKEKLKNLCEECRLRFINENSQEVLKSMKAFIKPLVQKGVAESKYGTYTPAKEVYFSNHPHPAPKGKNPDKEPL